VPEISRFYGIVIQLFADDHNPPHFHAHYGEHEASFLIESLSVLEGALPRRALHLVREWAELHRDEIHADWDLTQHGLPPRKIAPLP
jgi:hypothetical protein